MWVLVINSLTSILALINFIVGVGGAFRWMWLVTSLCSGLTAVREYRKSSKKEK